MLQTLLNQADVEGSAVGKAIGHLSKSHTIQTTVTGSPTAVTIRVWGSLNGVFYFPVKTYNLRETDLIAGGAGFFLLERTMAYVKHELVTLTGGSDPAVTTYHGCVGENE